MTRERRLPLFKFPFLGTKSVEKLWARESGVNFWSLSNLLINHGNVSLAIRCFYDVIIKAIYGQRVNVNS